MIPNKISYIHFRNEVDGQISSYGGATVAWMVEEDGKVVVGYPARCRAEEHFVKSTGAGHAYRNLMYSDPIITINQEDYLDLCVQSFNEDLEYLYNCTPIARNMIKKVLEPQIRNNPQMHMSSSWYENLVRSFLVYKNGRLRYQFNGRKGGIA